MTASVASSARPLRERNAWRAPVLSVRACRYARVRATVPFRLFVCCVRLCCGLVWHRSQRWRSAVQEQWALVAFPSGRAGLLFVQPGPVFRIIGVPQGKYPQRPTRVRVVCHVGPTYLMYREHVCRYLDSME
jgi:hypothetical protein